MVGALEKWPLALEFLSPPTMQALPATLEFSTTQVVDGHIFIVTINRPKKLNALSYEVS